MNLTPFESAAADLSSILLKICLQGEGLGDRETIEGGMAALRQHARDPMEQSFVSALEQDMAGLPLFSTDPEHPAGQRGYLALVFELQAWAGGGEATFRPWLAASTSPYTASDAARDNYVATKSVTYTGRPLSLLP